MLPHTRTPIEGLCAPASRTAQVGFLQSMSDSHACSYPVAGTVTTQPLGRKLSGHFEARPGPEGGRRERKMETQTWASEQKA